MVVTDDDTGESVTYDLGKYDYGGLHKLMRRLGFELKQGASIPSEAGAIQPIALAKPEASEASHPVERWRMPAKHEAPSVTAASLHRRGVETNVQAPNVAEGTGAAAADTLGLRNSVMAAIKAGDEILAQGFVVDGAGRTSAVRVGGVICVGMLLALLLCYRIDRLPGMGMGSGGHTHAVAMQPRRLLGLGTAPSGGHARYAPLSPVPEMLSPVRDSANKMA